MIAHVQAPVEISGPSNFSRSWQRAPTAIGAVNLYDANFQEKYWREWFIVKQHKI